MAARSNSQAFLFLVQCFGPILDQGYVYTGSQGFQKGVSINYEFRKDINAQMVFTKKQLGLGLSKNIGSGIKLGAGVASDYLKFKPELYVSIMKEWRFK